MGPISPHRIGDTAALGLLNRSAILVGQTLAGLANFFNPSLIVIGGGVAHAGDAYLATIRQVIYARSTALATRELLVQVSHLGSRAGVIGAASMVLDELFSMEQLGRWIDRGRLTRERLERVLGPLAEHAPPPTRDEFLAHLP